MKRSDKQTIDRSTDRSITLARICFSLVVLHSLFTLYCCLYNQTSIRLISHATRNQPNNHHVNQSTSHWCSTLCICWAQACLLLARLVLQWMQIWSGFRIDQKTNQAIDKLVIPESILLRLMHLSYQQSLICWSKVWAYRQMQRRLIVNVKLELIVWVIDWLMMDLYLCDVDRTQDAIEAYHAYQYWWYIESLI